MAVRLFDLNIEEVLEAWEVSHPIREVISNALDEQTLSGGADIDIAKDDARGPRPPRRQKSPLR